MLTLTSSLDTIDSRITSLHGRPVLLEGDLARIHEVPVRRLREIVAERAEHFPGELCFQPESEELPLDRCHEHPNAFTEQGAWMLAALLGTPNALELTIEISRAFERYRRSEHPPAPGRY